MPGILLEKSAATLSEESARTWWSLALQLLQEHFTRERYLPANRGRHHAQQPQGPPTPTHNKATVMPTGVRRGAHSGGEGGE